MGFHPSSAGLLNYFTGGLAGYFGPQGGFSNGLKAMTIGSLTGGISDLMAKSAPAAAVPTVAAPTAAEPATQADPSVAQSSMVGRRSAIAAAGQGSAPPSLQAAPVSSGEGTLLGGSQ